MTSPGARLLAAGPLQVQAIAAYVGIDLVARVVGDVLASLSEYRFPHPTVQTGLQLALSIGVLHSAAQVQARVGRKAGKVKSELPAPVGGRGSAAKGTTTTSASEVGPRSPREALTTTLALVLAIIASLRLSQIASPPAVNGSAGPLEWATVLPLVLEGGKRYRGLVRPGSEAQPAQKQWELRRVGAGAVLAAILLLCPHLGAANVGIAPPPSSSFEARFCALLVGTAGLVSMQGLQSAARRKGQVSTPALSTSRGPSSHATAGEAGTWQDKALALMARPLSPSTHLQLALAFLALPLILSPEIPRMLGSRHWAYFLEPGFWAQELVRATLGAGKVWGWLALLRDCDLLSVCAVVAAKELLVTPTYALLFGNPYAASILGVREALVLIALGGFVAVSVDSGNLEKKAERER